jgi:hypothetical protein
MSQTLEQRFSAAQSRAKTTSKLQRAFDALRAAHDDVSAAKAAVAKTGVRISARTWAKAISARRPFSSDVSNPAIYSALRYGI